MDYLILPGDTTESLVVEALRRKIETGGPGLDDTSKLAARCMQCGTMNRLKMPAMGLSLRRTLVLWECETCQEVMVFEVRIYTEHGQHHYAILNRQLARGLRGHPFTVHGEQCSDVIEGLTDSEEPPF